MGHKSIRILICAAAIGMGGNHYLDKHLMISSDQGQSWTNGHSALTLPVSSDDENGVTGAIELTSSYGINLALDLQGSNFLHSIYPRGNFVPYRYMMNGGGGVAKYGRYNLSSHSIDIAPVAFKGQTITLNSNGLFFASGALFAVGASAHGEGTVNIAALVSFDDGVTWSDYASDKTVNGTIQYMTGSPKVTGDGAVVGEFTVQDSTGSNNVYFFKIGGI